MLIPGHHSNFQANILGKRTFLVFYLETQKMVPTRISKVNPWKSVTRKIRARPYTSPLRNSVKNPPLSLKQQQVNPSSKEESKIRYLAKALKTQGRNSSVISLTSLPPFPLQRPPLELTKWTYQWQHHSKNSSFTSLAAPGNSSEIIFREKKEERKEILYSSSFFFLETGLSNLKRIAPFFRQLLFLTYYYFERFGLLSFFFFVPDTSYNLVDYLPKPQWFVPRRVLSHLQYCLVGIPVVCRENQLTTQRIIEIAYTDCLSAIGSATRCVREEAPRDPSLYLQTMPCRQKLYISSSTDSDLEAFSRNLTDGSFTTW